MKKYVPCVNILGKCLIIPSDSNSLEEAKGVCTRFALDNFHWTAIDWYQERQLVSVCVRSKNPNADNWMDKQRGTPLFVYEEVKVERDGLGSCSKHGILNRETAIKMIEEEGGIKKYRHDNLGRLTL